MRETRRDRAQNRNPNALVAPHDGEDRIERNRTDKEVGVAVAGVGLAAESILRRDGEHGVVAAVEHCQVGVPGAVADEGSGDGGVAELARAGLVPEVGASE